MKHEELLSPKSLHMSEQSQIPESGIWKVYNWSWENYTNAL